MSLQERNRIQNSPSESSRSSSNLRESGPELKHQKIFAFIFKGLEGYSHFLRLTASSRRAYRNSLNSE